MRGGSKPNYDAASIGLAEQALAAHKLTPQIMVDCSHGNSNKDPSLQPLVLADCIAQICAGNRSIMGMMLESNLHEGTQTIPQDISKLRYGVSVTDACINWDSTEAALRQAREKLRAILPKRKR
jgi:3-deoxy-7-phosphoheptulonate synthase